MSSYGDAIQEMRHELLERSEKMAIAEARIRLWNAFSNARGTGLGGPWMVTGNTITGSSWDEKPRASALLELGRELVAQGLAAWALAEMDCPVTRLLLGSAVKGDENGLQEQLAHIDTTMTPAQEYAAALQAQMREALDRLRKKWADSLPPVSAGGQSSSLAETPQEPTLKLEGGATVRDQPPKLTRAQARANARAMKLVADHPEFASEKLRVREWVRAGVCCSGMVTKLPLWRLLANRAGRARKGKAPRVVALSKKLLAVTPDRDETLSRLTAEQRADREPSSLDKCRSKVMVKKHL